MPNYRRVKILGGTYFITQVTHQRETWLCTEIGRKALREAIAKVSSLSLKSSKIRMETYFKS